MTSDDRNALKTLDRDLKNVVFGQDQAIDALVSAIRMARSGLGNPRKPIGNFLFSGPTGVGKTEVARQLAYCLGVELLRFDMSEYMERHAVSRLIGAPPGYVGFDQGGQLTEAVTKHPYSVVLLDEIEKAHPDVFNVLLQVMDHGTLTDNNGRKADFRNVTIIMTTNAGAMELSKGTMGFTAMRASGDEMGEIKRLFTPEFRNRLDAIVSFAALDGQVILKVVDKFLLELENQLHEKKVDASFTDRLKAFLAKKGFDPQMGARPMARLIQDAIRKALADELLFGRLVNGGKVTIDVGEDDKVVLRVRGAAGGRRRLTARVSATPSRSPAVRPGAAARIRSRAPAPRAQPGPPTPAGRRQDARSWSKSWRKAGASISKSRSGSRSARIANPSITHCIRMARDSARSFRHAAAAVLRAAAEPILEVGAREPVRLAQCPGDLRIAAGIGAHGQEQRRVHRVRNFGLPLREGPAEVRRDVGRRMQLRDPGAIFLELALDDREHDRTLAREVPIHEARAHLRRLGDGGHAGRVEAVPDEAPGRGGDDARALRRRARADSRDACRRRWWAAPGPECSWRRQACPLDPAPVTGAALVATGFRPPNRRCTTTKNSGMKTMPRNVPTIMPPSTPVPIARWRRTPRRSRSPAAVRRGRTRATSSGSGAGGRRPAAIVAEIRSMPARRCTASRTRRSGSRSCSTGRRWSASPPGSRRRAPCRAARSRARAPRIPSGTTSSTAVGTVQLSYSAARHRNTTSIDSA